MSARWADLGTRVASAAVMVAVGGLCIWLGGWAFAALVVVLTGLMLWELARMTAPERPGEGWPMAALGAGSLTLALWLDGYGAVALLLPALGLALTPRRDPWLAAGWALAALVAGYGLVMLRLAGVGAILWLLLVVVASDVLGYFVGRIMGGPKFWPAVSPKKTWSGTAAGWVGAALVGAGFWAAGHGPAALVILSALVAFAGQMGDIAESWIKRRAGVKDASNLIPGHGGVMDRFDALTGAAVAVMLIGLVVQLPLPA